MSGICNFFRALDFINIKFYPKFYVLRHPTLEFIFSPSSYESSFRDMIYGKKLNECRLNTPRVPISTRISLANNLDATWSIIRALL